MILGDLHAAVVELLAAAGTSCAVAGSVVGAGVVVAIEGYWQLFENTSARNLITITPSMLTFQQVFGREGGRTCLSKLRLLEQMRLRRPQMRKCMSLDRTARACCPSSWRHSHHRPALSDLRPSWRRHARVHRLHHPCPRMSVRVLSWGHWMTWRQSRMLRHALMGRKWLRHHHRYAAKSPRTGLLKSVEERGGDTEDGQDG